MKSEWIPVTDRMPRNGQHVLFCGYGFENDGTFYHAGYYSGEGRHKGWHISAPLACIGKTIPAEYVTHWQPMPWIPEDEGSSEGCFGRDV